MGYKEKASAIFCEEFDKAVLNTIKHHMKEIEGLYNNIAHTQGMIDKTQAIVDDLDGATPQTHVITSDYSRGGNNHECVVRKT